MGMAAARFLQIDFSMTLHGSDLLLGAAYLDVKLQECKFCITVSEFNRQYIIEHFPAMDPSKIIVQRLGVDPLTGPVGETTSGPRFVILTVGRLHAVKNHAFLLHACRALKERGLEFSCLIAGEGPERARLEALIRQLSLENHVQLLGHVHPARLARSYVAADLVVLTSRSEGLPLTLMEAMAHKCVVLAPAITGIPELVIDGQTGFLYEPGSLDDFLSRIEMIFALRDHLLPIRRAAREYVEKNFCRATNLARFGELFIARVTSSEIPAHAHSVLQ
jgi:glycosyltransferase involved in cell wall biosynthesis